MILKLREEQHRWAMSNTYTQIGLPKMPPLRGWKISGWHVLQRCRAHGAAEDCDRLWNTIKATAPELFMAWRDCGLLDERGQIRPANEVWREYCGRPQDSGQ